MPCKDGSGILQNINLSEVDVNRCLLSYCSSNSSKNTDKRTIGMASSRQSAACSTESTNNRPFPYKEETSRTCDVEDSTLHLEHSASENNVECISATDSKIDTMKEMQNQLTTLKQLNPSRNIHANKKTGSNDVESGGNDVLKNNFSVAAKSLSSINKPSDAVTGGDVLPLEKCEQTDASETCTVTNPIHRVGSNGLLVQEKSHAIRPKATMSSNDLLKLLRKFNMTLKAVPADSEIAKIIAKSARKFNGTIAYSHDSSSLHDSNKANGFRPAKCLPSKRLNKVTQPGDRCRLHCKTTCTGTFSKWKLDESYLKSRSAYSNNNGDSKADHERGDSRLRTSSTAKFPKRQLPLCRKLNSIQGRSENTFNNDAKCAKGSSASYAHMPLHDIPLAKAFDDLKNRDKAIRETLEIFTEEGSEHKSMSGCAKDSLLDSINSKNDPLLTTAAFQSGNDEMDEFSFRVSTVIIKPKKPSVDQNESCVKILPPESVDENWSHIDDTLFDVKKQSMQTAKPTSSTSIKIRHGDERSVSTRGKCGVLNTTDENIKLESMDVDHNYHRRDCDHLYSVKVEKWTPKEVLSWLSSTIQQFTESESAANDISSRKERHNLSEKLFSHVRDAEGLLSVTLDKLKQICSDDSLARYLFERVQALWTSRKKEGNGTASNMYSAGQCAISAPPLVNATSMEQLEESVNIDDLFTGDGMFGSVDFSDAFDSQTGSYLKYLGNDYVHTPTSFLNHEGISANLFSAKTRPPASNQGEYNAIRYMQSQRHDSYAYSTHYDFHGAGFNSNSYISHDGKVSTSDRNCTVNSAVGTGGWSSSSARNSDTHLYSTSMSPSTYYDLSTVGNGQSSLAHSNGCASTGQISESYHLHKARDPTCHYANVIVGFREVSDNDSDIHSPNIQSPNKHVGMNALPSRNMYQLPRDHHHRQTYALQKRYLPTSNDMKTSWTSSNEVAVSTQASFPCHNQCCDEKWDCSSTSSNTTAVSVGSESKLLNMDDCKSFHAYEFPENAPQNTHIMYSRPSSPIMDSFSLTENKSFGSETVETIVQRNVATIYPEFVTQVQRSVSINKSGSCSPVEHDTISNMFHGDSLESNGDISSVLRSSDNEDRNNGVEYSVSGIPRSRSVSNRRHTSDNTDSYVDNFDLKIRRTSGKSITLWEFIRDTLLDPQYCPRLIKWEDRKAGIFRFVQSDVVAGMWGDKKNNPKMTYEKLSRAMRYYYNRGILERVDGRRLVYKFGRNAHGWQQNEIDHSISSRYITEAKPVKRGTIVNYSQAKIKPRKIKSCKIPVSHCDEIIPATKRRRESRETSPAYLSISSNNETQSPDTQFLTRFNDRANDDLASTTNGESLLSATCPAEDNRQTTPITSHDVTISDQPSCIVFVARQEVMTNEESDEKEILLLENTNESSQWQQDAQELLPSKLPSANVLLGKQYKIANTVM